MVLFQDLEDADVSDAAGEATAQRQPDANTGRRSPLEPFAGRLAREPQPT